MAKRPVNKRPQTTSPSKRQPPATPPTSQPKPPRGRAAQLAEAIIDQSTPRLGAVVAIGASAGGLEALTQLFERIPAETDLAFIVVQHLSPSHASLLPELIASKTALRVIPAANRTLLDAGTVYVIPPNVQMEVVDGELHLLPRPSDRSQFTPIDFLMQSVARWAQERAIGIVLSGTASDGANGLREVKAAGGITIAQRPDTAKHDGMPRAAIATGMVDLVLSPAEIADHIVQVRQHPYISAPRGAAPAQELPIEDGQLRDILLVLRRASGIDFRQYKMPTVKRRLLRRMALLRLTELDTYVRHLTESPAEAKALAQDLLIHVTRFFRDPDSFEVIATHVLPELLTDQRDDPLRIWVPGCATGEEAYSIGIAVFEAMGERITERRVQIFATDVSETAIEIARAGTYPVSISADVTPERLKRFFTRADGGYRVVKPLRDICVFARHDLTRDPPFSRQDFVVCRNVLIYLDVALQKRLISVFHYALRANGFLMLGPAETTGPQAYFSIVDKKWRIFRKSSAEVVVPFSAPAEFPPAAHRVVPLGRKPPVEGKSVQDEATRLILDRYGPPGVVLDSNLQIVQFRGHTGPYLEPAAGEPNLSVLKMARGGLLHPLRSALQQAKRRSRIVRKGPVHVQRNGDWAEIAIEVVPLSTSRGEHYLVLFDETQSSKPMRGKKGARPTPTREVNAHVSDLRRELAASREYLQSIIQELEAANEELQSANEEILSSNEELQSTNEELDTAKEELQSTNEELNTVNEELHSRNEELTRANSDLTNLLGSVDIPIVIVGSDLGVRRFTPRAEQLFNLIPGDVGRPIRQINPNFTCDDLEHLIEETIAAIAPREREVQDRNGQWLSLRIRPYRGVDNRLDGAVISVFDIDARKRSQEMVEHSRDRFRAIVDLIPDLLVLVGANGRVQWANKRFYDAAGLSPKQVEDRDLDRLADGRWDRAMLRAVIAETRRSATPLERIVADSTERDGQSQWRLRATALTVDGQQGVLLSFTDLSHGRPNEA